MKELEMCVLQYELPFDVRSQLTFVIILQMCNMMYSNQRDCVMQDFLQ